MSDQIERAFNTNMDPRSMEDRGTHEVPIKTQSLTHMRLRASHQALLYPCVCPLQLCIVPWSDIIAANNWGIIGTLGTTEFGILPSHPDHSTHIAYMTSGYLDSSMKFVYYTWSMIRIDASAVGWLLYFRRLFPSWIISLSVAPLSG